MYIPQQHSHNTYFVYMSTSQGAIAATQARRSQFTTYRSHSRSTPPRRERHRGDASQEEPVPAHRSQLTAQFAAHSRSTPPRRERHRVDASQKEPVHGSRHAVRSSLSEHVTPTRAPSRRRNPGRACAPTKPLYVRRGKPYQAKSS